VAGAIKTYAGKSVESPTNSAIFRRKIKEWKAADGTSQSETFDDLPTDLPRLYETCFSMKGWSMLTKVQVWSMFLGQFGIAGRGSCITDFCSLYEDLEVPPASACDADGVPPWVELGQRKWKGRDDSDAGRYGLRLWRNRVDPRFCPVSWLLIFMILAGHPETGPVWGRWARPRTKGKSPVQEEAGEGERVREGGDEEVP
jgi:hypothetical protein